MNQAQYDIVIVGGGPAGLCAAIAAAQQGCRSVALIERKRRWGRPIQCAEMVPKLLAQIVPLEPDSIVQPVTGLRFYFERKEIGQLRAPGYVLDRPRFEAALAQRAAALGVAVRQPVSVGAVSGGGVTVLQGGEKSALEARVLIGADGPRSRVRRSVLPARLDFACALQHVLPLAARSDEALVFLSPSYGAGYGWCFPRGQQANVGVALEFAHRHRLRSALDALVDWLIRAGWLTSSKPLRRTGGLVPVSGPLPQCVVGATLLVGDAAGQVQPLTGAGIPTACACGHLAGQAAARAVAEQCFARLNEYETQWRDLYGSYFARGLQSRQSLRTAGPDSFLDTICATWHLRSCS